ncbi:MAG: TIGR01906 family membrane protein, partial [Dehalococcoidia bacterium]
MTSTSDTEGAAPPPPPPTDGARDGDDRPSQRVRRATRRPSLIAVAAGQIGIVFEAVWSHVQRARWLATIGAAIFVVALPIALIGTNVRILFTSSPLYTFALDTYDVAAITGIPREELSRAMAEIRDYFTNNQELLRITVVDEQGRSDPLFTPREVIHMRDVKELVQSIFRAQELALVLLAIYVALRFAIERQRAWAGLARLTRASMLGTLAFAVAFGITALLGFDRLFNRFHELSFSNDFWQLDPAQDRLVQMFPQDFWLVSTVILAGLTIVQVLALLAVSWRYLQKEPLPRPLPPLT